MNPYIAILVPEDEAGFSVFFPDVPGCVTQGEDMAEAHSMAVDALSLWMASAEDHGVAIPKPRSLEAIKADKAWAKEYEVDWRSATAVLVPVMPQLGRPERVNVSLDSNKLRAIDAYAEKSGMTRSAVLEAGAEMLISSGAAPAGVFYHTKGLASAAAPRFRSGELMKSTMGSAYTHRGDKGKAGSKERTVVEKDAKTGTLVLGRGSSPAQTSSIKRKR